MIRKPLSISAETQVYIKEAALTPTQTPPPNSPQHWYAARSAACVSDTQTPPVLLSFFCKEVGEGRSQTRSGPSGSLAVAYRGFILRHLRNQGRIFGTHRVMGEVRVAIIAIKPAEGKLSLLRNPSAPHTDSPAEGHGAAPTGVGPLPPRPAPLPRPPRPQRTRTAHRGHRT